MHETAELPRSTTKRLSVAGASADTPVMHHYRFTNRCLEGFRKPVGWGDLPRGSNVTMSSNDSSSESESTAAFGPGESLLAQANWRKRKTKEPPGSSKVIREIESGNFWGVGSYVGTGNGGSALVNGLASAFVAT